jgi:hypothetical protein
MLKRRISADGLSFYPEFSGKVSIYKLCLLFIKQMPERNIALVPDYICNVVCLAVERAGYNILPYSTDEMLEPNIDEIHSILLSNSNVGVLLTASIFGSSALLPDLQKNAIKEFILDKNIKVIVDLCQDINLINDIPKDYGKNMCCIVSFNDKSFFGAMGGGIISSFSINEYQKKLTFGNTIRLYLWVINKINVLYLFPKVGIYKKPIPSTSIEPVKYEFGYCLSFPWTFEEVRIAKIQIILAIIGIDNLTLFNSAKKKLVAIDKLVIKTKNISTAPFAPIFNWPGNNWKCINTKRKIKPSYALHNTPTVSLRPDLVILHNKGYFDEVQ